MLLNWDGLTTRSLILQNTNTTRKFKTEILTGLFLENLLL